MGSPLLTFAFVLAGGLAVGEAQVGGAIMRGEVPLRPAWTEVAWPFAFDAWPAGRAFRCAAAACGSELGVYVRPKVGFCNCATGVSDDDEIDRVGDLVLLSERYRPLLPGEPVTVGTMAGRARAYLVEGPQGIRHYAVGVALSKKCDALVAMMVSERPFSPELENAGLALLKSTPVVGWAEASVGLQ